MLAKQNLKSGKVIFLKLRLSIVICRLIILYRYILTSDALRFTIIILFLHYRWSCTNAAPFWVTQTAWSTHCFTPSLMRISVSPLSVPSSVLLTHSGGTNTPTGDSLLILALLYLWESYLSVVLQQLSCINKLLVNQCWRAVLFQIQSFVLQQKHIII